MADMDLQGIPKIAPGYRLQWEEVQQCNVLLYPEGMVQLNDSASFILEKLDGKRNVAEVTAALEEESGEPDLKADVLEFVVEAVGRGWVRVS